MRYARGFSRLAIIVGSTGAVNRPPFTLPWTASIVKQFTSARRARQYGLCQPGPIPASEDKSMSTRRMAYWWLRFVVSGRFLEKFLNLRRSRRP
jgi:hypothetical protein